MRIIDTILDKLHHLTHGEFTEAQVTAKLNALAVEHEKKTGEKLDWLRSEVDLRKLVGVPHDLETRKLDAGDLGYSGPFDGSAEMNQFLHAETMKAIEEKYIKLPKAGDA